MLKKCVADIKTPSEMMKSFKLRQEVMYREIPKNAIAIL
jgi:hypothetical protein